MARQKIDWVRHLTAFESSGLKLNDYCSEAGISPDTFRYHRYKKPKRQQEEEALQEEAFQEISVPSEITIVRSDDGELSLKGFDVSQLSLLVGAWADALSQ